MCQAIPGKILEVDGEKAVADFAGKKKGVSMKFVKAQVGEWVICAGEIVADRIEEKRAKEMLEGCGCNG